MAAIKEFSDFFLRDIKVNSGSTPDQEVNYPTDYLVNGVLKKNRFLKNHVPTEGVFRKLFASIPFKLNTTDTASTTEQGLVKVATDANAYNRTSAVDGAMREVIQPHQLPEIKNQLITTQSITGNINTGFPTITNVSDVDIIKFSIDGVVTGTGIPTGAKVISIDYGSGEIELDQNCTATTVGLAITQGVQDTLITTFSFKGLTIGSFKRTIGSKFRKMYYAVIAYHHSIVVDLETQRIQLSGDVTSPGNYKHYGTNSAGVKGWYGGNYIEANQTTALGSASNGNFCSTAITALTAGEYEVNFSGNIQCAGNNQNLKILIEFQKNGIGGRVIAHNSPAVVGEQLYTTLSAFTRVSVVDGDTLRVNVANQGTDIISADVYMDLKKII